MWQLGYLHRGLLGLGGAIQAFLKGVGGPMCACSCTEWQEPHSSEAGPSTIELAHEAEAHAARPATDETPEGGGDTYAGAGTAVQIPRPPRAPWMEPHMCNTH